MAPPLSSLGRFDAATRWLLRDEAGQNLVEYGLVVGLLGLAVLVSLSGMTDQLKTSFSTMGSAVAHAV